MRKFAFSLLAAALLFAVPVSSFGQGVEVGPGGVEVEPGRHYHRDPDCRALRQACIHKEDLGEAGEGNCARYRRLCR